jgi:hypothetical protein
LLACGSKIFPALIDGIIHLVIRSTDEANRREREHESGLIFCVWNLRPELPFFKYNHALGVHAELKSGCYIKNPMHRLERVGAAIACVLLAAQ